MIDPTIPLSEAALQHAAMPAIIVASNRGARDHDAEMLAAVAEAIGRADSQRRRNLTPFINGCLAILAIVEKPDTDGFWSEDNNEHIGAEILNALTSAGVLHKTPDGYVRSKALIAATKTEAASEAPRRAHLATVLAGARCIGGLIR